LLFPTTGFGIFVTVSWCLLVVGVVCVLGCVCYGFDMIPVSSKRVRLDGLHPEFVARLEHFFEDSRVRGKVVVVSGVRTVREQAALFDRYRNHGGVLAADPGRVFGGGWVGSWHMVQPDGFGYAVDLRLTGWVNWGTVHEVAGVYGVRPTVPGEDWHVQPRHVDGWFPSPFEREVVPSVDLVAIIAYIKGMAGYITSVPLRRGDEGRGGFVQILQVRLEELGFNPGAPDGIFGRKTEKAVKNLQRVSDLMEDGVVGGKTWRVLWP
jgi:hypothetical protein